MKLWLAGVRFFLGSRMLAIQVVPDKEMRKRPERPLNRLCDISDWRAGRPLSLVMQALGEGVYIHRKSWEYAMCLIGLETLGVVRPEARAVAVGAGSERPLFHYANRISEMVATDLYATPGREGDPRMLTNPEVFAPFDYRKDRLKVLRMDATGLDFPDASFDFGFCLSSIEHFGSREKSARAMQEMHRVLKPGGVVCISTELILNGANHAEYFSTEELDRTILRSAAFKLAGGGPDLSISRSLLLNPIDLDDETDLHVSPHIVLKQGNVVWTSVILFLRK